MEKACIVGYGVVGQATAKVFGIRKHYDVQEERSNITLKDVANCEFVFICTPSPVDTDGTFLVQDILNLIRQIESYGTGATYIIRSTVYPGLANHVMSELGIGRVVSNPEFLTEETAGKDSKYPPFVLLGGIDGRYLQKVKGLYESVIKSGPIILTDNITAELTKLAMNSYFALKVIFANQIYDYSKQIGANYETLKSVLERHPYGPRNHFTIWFKGKRGVNGKCLPKDTSALSHYSGLELITKIVQLNQQYIGLKEQNEH